MTPTTAAERIIAVKRKPCSIAKAPWIHVSLFWNSPMSDSLNGPAGPPRPAARRPFFAISAPHAPMPGSSPTTTAGACSRGVAWNACATIIIPIQSTIAIPASIGIAQAIHASVPVRQMSVTNTPFSIE